MCFSSPSIPSMPTIPQMPTATDPAVMASVNAERSRQAKALSDSTLLTGGQGASGGPSGKTLLGQ